MGDDTGRACSGPFPGSGPSAPTSTTSSSAREEQTAALLSLLRENRFLAVVGTSGSGKSSLVRAGLIPALHRGTMAQAGSNWEVVVLRPGGEPRRRPGPGPRRARISTTPRTPRPSPPARDPEPRGVGLVEAVRQSGGAGPETRTSSSSSTSSRSSSASASGDGRRGGGDAASSTCSSRRASGGPDLRRHHDALGLPGRLRDRSRASPRR